MASLISLSGTADVHRSSLAKWALEEAEQGQDYVVNEKGDRIYNNTKISQFVEPLLEEMGLRGWKYTMWRFAISQPLEPSRQDKLYTVPINIISGVPRIVQEGRQNQVVLSCYIVTSGNFEITPELDCLFIGNI